MPVLWRKERGGFDFIIDKDPLSKAQKLYFLYSNFFKGPIIPLSLPHYHWCFFLVLNSKADLIEINFNSFLVFLQDISHLEIRLEYSE